MPDLMTVHFSVCPSVMHYHKSVRGKTGDYEVTFEGGYGWSCSCPSFRFRGEECKHIKSVQADRCAWNEDALCGSGAPRPKNGKCPKCGEPLASVGVGV